MMVSIVRKFLVDDEKPKNLEFEPVPPKNVLLASVAHGISCLLSFAFLRVSASAASLHQFSRQASVDISIPPRHG
jgi:hypothetical protein